MVKHTNEVLSTIESVVLAVTRAESSQRGYVLTKENRFLVAFSEARSDASKQLQELRRLTLDNPNQQVTVGQLEKDVDNRLQTISLLLRNEKGESDEGSKFSAVSQENALRMQKVVDTAQLMIKTETTLLESRTKLERRSEIAVAASFGLCILVSFLLLAWAYRVIVKYDRARERAAEQVLQLNAELEQRVVERTLELEIANSNLSRSNEDLTRFAYVASHDLQEPLRTISSYVGLLGFRYQGKLDDQADKYIKFVIDGAKRMQNLVQDLLIYSRVGTEALKLREVTLESVLQSVRESLDLLIHEQKAEIVSEQLPIVIADESKLTQVFMNITANAIKFRKPDQPPRVTVSATQRENEWEFSIADNGIGFDQQHSDRIFVVFQRLHGVGVYPGTGIGLAICKRVIEQHGGRIWAASTPGCGSTFTFTLPRHPRSAREEEPIDKDVRMVPRDLSI